VTVYPPGADRQKSDLQLGTQLGSGGQGTVHDLNGPGSGLVYKEYLDPGRVNSAELRALVALPSGMDAADRDALLAQTAWPRNLVLNGGIVTGFLMPKVPSSFWWTSSTGPKLLELQYLLFPPKPLWSSISLPDAQGRLHLARRIASLFQLLHGQGIVVGDVSMANLLWSEQGDVYLLDCDGTRRHGRPPVTPQPETPDWDDPHQPASGPDLDTDRYKLALLVSRILTFTYDHRPGLPPALVPDLPPRVVTEVTARLAAAAGPRGTRPDAAQWSLALSDRGTINLGPLPPVRQPPVLPKAPADGHSTRPTLQLRPPP